MALASGASVGLSYVEETNQGETPDNPQMKELRSTGRNINLQKNELQSNERRSDREQVDSRHGFNQVQGSFPLELAMQDYDDFIQAALSGTWTTGAATGTTSLDVTSASGGGTISGGSGDFAGFKVGDFIETAGFTNSENNGTFRVQSVAGDDSSVTVDATLVSETGDGDETAEVIGQVLGIGTTLRTFTIERRFTDVGEYQVFRGCAIQSMDVSIQPDSLVTATLNIIGLKGGEFETTLGTPSEPNGTSPFSAFDGAVYLDNQEVAVVTGIDFSLANGRTVNPVVGAKVSPAVFEGEANITGTVTLFFETPAEYNLFKNEAEAALQVKLDDINGSDFHNLTFPRCKFNTGDMDPPQEGPIVLSMQFRALRDSGVGTSFRYQRSND